MFRFRAKLCAAQALSFALLAFLLISSNAHAEEAGLIVRHGDGGFTYALVYFEEPTISSFDLLRRSTISLSTVSFGGLGEAVCTLDGEGCGVADCRQRLCQTGEPDSPFWQFFRFNNGAWETQPLGASAAKAGDGTIDGWSWTGGESGLSETSLNAIAERLGVTADDRAAAANRNSGAFVGSFDAEGNPAELVTPVSVKDTDQLLLGVGALILLIAFSVIGTQIRHRRMKRR